MTKTKIELLWDDELLQAAKRPLGRDGLRLTRIESISNIDIYAGIDDADRVVLAISVKKRPPAISLDSRTFDHFRQQRADGSWLLVLRLRGKGLEPVFGRLCQDLVDSTISVIAEDELLGIFQARLQLWQKLFLGSNDGLLEVHQIKGLLAELLILGKILQRGLRDAAEIVAGWVGPRGADQDFIYGSGSIEVKASAIGRRSVSISSLEQLDCVTPLALVVIALETSSPSTTGAFSLNSLVNLLESQIVYSAPALLTLRERLLEAGYVEHPYYDENWFNPVSTQIFDVGENFPRLTKKTVPPELTQAKYELDITYLAAFRRNELPQ
ncbi:PD-(D/E)XK motif protein [Variovorax boronicumulans]|uniref:PD-(D/E)XK motif protein n=1 Tax=Variovorax boronicumulans TaxID=436515 RepID=UPI002786F42C|nr:PD-(D/E)XK motif protein [Variovorax boronicumulans]MDQ0045033.1 hypothetical protein [Variovorax boronicumulans]